MITAVRPAAPLLGACHRPQQLQNIPWGLYYADREIDAAYGVRDGYLAVVEAPSARAAIDAYSRRQMTVAGFDLAARPLSPTR
jgi:hypothetical protein